MSPSPFGVQSSDHSFLSTRVLESALLVRRKWSFKTGLGSRKVQLPPRHVLRLNSNTKQEIHLKDVRTLWIYVIGKVLSPVDASRFCIPDVCDIVYVAFEIIVLGGKHQRMRVCLRTLP